MEVVSLLNQNKIVWGITMILLNFGSRFVIADLGKSHEIILSSQIVKKIVIFSMFFIATRDIITSFLLTLGYIIIIDGMLHEKRKYCILPKSILLKAHNNTNVSETEYIKAKETIDKYNKQSENVKHMDDLKTITYLNYLNNVTLLSK
jgi:hypothetical protein